MGRFHWLFSAFLVCVFLLKKFDAVCGKWRWANGTQNWQILSP